MYTIVQHKHKTIVYIIKLIIAKVVTKAIKTCIINKAEKQ